MSCPDCDVWRLRAFTTEDKAKKLQAILMVLLVAFQDDEAFRRVYAKLKSEAGEI